MMRRPPPLSALRPFEAAARLESFSRAADELSLTHGAVSHQVRALEEHLGTPLFERHGKRVSLTAVGRAFAGRVRAALAELASAADEIREGRRGNRLTVSVLPSFASRWLMPRLIRFMDANPDIEVNVFATNVLANFASDGVDIAIRFGRGPWPGLACEKFLDDEVFPVASPAMNRGRLPKTPRELAQVRLIREDRDYWEEWFESAGVKLEPALVAPRFNDAAHSLAAAARGEGVALTRRSLVGDDLERGALVRITRRAIRIAESYWLVCPQAMREAPRVKAFRDWMFAEQRRKR
jgi:LysR family glycine cleavage system transcriptional activator